MRRLLDLLVALRVLAFAVAVVAGVGAWVWGGCLLVAKLDALWELLVVRGSRL